MNHNDRYITSDKEKSDFFIKHYRGVSKIGIFKEKMTEIRILKTSLLELR